MSKDPKSSNANGTSRILHEGYTPSMEGHKPKFDTSTQSFAANNSGERGYTPKVTFTTINPSNPPKKP